MIEIAIVGTGYAGLVMGTFLADIGNIVVFIDNDVQKVSEMKKEICPIFEPGLQAMMIWKASSLNMNY